MTLTRSQALSLAVAVAALSGSIWVSAAAANSPVVNFTVTPSTTQAGGHPNVVIHEENLTRFNQNLPAPNCGCQDPKNITFNLPTGLIGDPHATPQCTQAEFGEITECSVDSQVGTVCAVVTCGIPIYNMVPPPGDAGLLGFKVPLVNVPVYVVLSARTDSDFGLTSEVVGLTHILPFPGVEKSQQNFGYPVSGGLVLWGVPADPSHDPERWHPRGCDPSHVGGGTGDCEPGGTSNAEALPFIDNPTTCGVPLTASVEIFSFDLGTARRDAPYPATTGCDQLSFNPSLFVQPTTRETDSASGSDVNLQVPQESSPIVPSGSEIRSQSVELPQGFTLTPNASDGKVACTDAEAKLTSREAAECPENAKVGTLGIRSSSLPGLLPGYVYLGEPKPGDPYRLILVADGFNVHVKLLGSVLADPQTGQLTLTFPSLPQFPFESFDMHFFGSERGLLATPTKCGEYPVNASFTPWDASLSEQHSTQYFILDSGPNGRPCPSSELPFAPSFEAGVTNATAGVHSTFTLNLVRNDGDQSLRSLSVTTPPGFSATLAGIPYCPEAAIAAAENPLRSGREEELSPSCPGASQVGVSDTGTGTGTHPVYFPGRVYLAGPYKGAPLSLVVVTPARSGPYDFGSIAVRAALNIDPSTAEVTAVTDPLPQIVAGVPLRLRSIRVDLDRQGFALNPTNCDPFAVSAKVGGDQNGVASLSSHFQATSCTSLPFNPRLNLKLSGGVNRLGHPAIHATLTAKPGEANTKIVSVALPKGEQLDNSHLGTVCTKVDFARDTCPADSLLGRVEVASPILDQPLTGFAYLRSSRQGLPDLALKLTGQVAIEAVAKIDSVNGGLRATFSNIPDVPFSTITLNLAGGKKGLLQNTRDLCGADKEATVKMAGQNGLRIKRTVPLNPACGKAGHRRHLQSARAVG